MKVICFVYESMGKRLWDRDKMPVDRMWTEHIMVQLALGSIALNFFRLSDMSLGLIGNLPFCFPYFKFILCYPFFSLLAFLNIHAPPPAHVCTFLPLLLCLEVKADGV
ncbi:hypothetical protein ILYODFUR_003429 [Ilyodon furcidens]|uniref:Uncharacterized protein n=1 Tax=Ilyodon furcidens TaxID=33524 RepID=A0ABV0TRJ6_9TELE